MNQNLAQLSGNELMSYNNSGGLQAGVNSLAAGYAGDYFYHYYPQFYPSYHYIESKSKIEQAFKIVSKLLENKIIEKELTVKEFMKVVNDIAEVV